MGIPRWFFLFFFLSGFSSLVYEVVWLRLSMAAFGVNAVTVSFVLSLFMAGLGLGSWLAGRRSERWRTSSPARPLRLYALCELLIGVSGVAVPLQIGWGRHLLESAGAGIEWGSASHYLFAGVWTSMSLGPWCFFMGATLPVAMAAIRGLRPDASPRSFSFLYFANVVGAASGTLTSAFVLIELFGFRGTLLAAASLNMLAALGAWLWSRSPAWTGAPAPAAAAASGAPDVPSVRGDARTWMLFLTGFTGMAMEVAWVRLYTPYVGTTVYAFAGLLGIFLAVGALGTWLYRTLAARRPLEIDLVWLWLAFALLALLPLWAVAPTLRPTPKLASGFARIALGIAPVCGLMGFFTPMLVDRISGGDPARAGRAYAVNVLGSIAGPLASSFVLLPRLGARAGLVALAVLMLAVAGTSILRARSSRALTAGLGGVVALLLAWTAAIRGADGWPADAVVLRDYEATVVGMGHGMQKRLFVNGIDMTGLTTITKYMAHLPLAHLDRPPQNALVIAFGMGTTYRSLLRWGVRTTAVDLIPSVPRAFPYFHADAAELAADPRGRIVVDDGRRFLARSRERFDVITVDPPPPPTAAGSSLLYSTQFYDLVKKRLAPDGILQHWIPGNASPETLASVARSLEASFPFVRAYLSAADWGVHFIARTAPFPEQTFEEILARMPPAAAADLVEWHPRANVRDLMWAVLDSEYSLPRLIASHPGAPLLTDDRPFNEYFLVRETWPGLWERWARCCLEPPPPPRARVAETPQPRR